MLEPDGSITKYYPLVKESTKRVLESYLASSSNFYEFVLSIGEYICSESVCEELSFLVAAFSWHIQELHLMNKIRERYHNFPTVLTFTYPSTSYNDRLVNCPTVKSCVENSLSSDIPDWMRAQLLMHQAYYCFPVIPAAETLDTLDEVRELLQSNQELSSFLANITFIEASVHHRTGNMSDSLLLSTKALEMARKLNHQYLLSTCLRSVGNILRNLNPTESISYQEEANVIINKMGIPQRMHEIRNDMGLTLRVLGEDDLALESFLSALEVYDSGYGPDDTISFNIASLCLEMGRYKDALEWINTAFKYHNGLGFPMMFTIKAETLIRLRNFDEVDELIDRAMKLALEIGSERGIGMAHRARGIQQAEMNLWSEALAHLEEAYTYLEPLGLLLLQNSLILELAKVETKLAINKKSVDDSEYSGPWMRKLFLRAEKFKLPGIKMKAAILRADYLTHRGEIELAKKILEEALGIMDSPSVLTLQQEIHSRLEQLTPESR